MGGTTSSVFGSTKERCFKMCFEAIRILPNTLIILWPEGTRYTKSKHEQSLKFAEERKLPLLKHHLIPRSKGFLISLPIFREKLGAIYDVVLSQNPNDEIRLTAKDVLLGKKICVHLYVKRIPMEQVPVDEHKAIKFLNDMFVDKDELQEKFFTTGQYFENESEKSMEKMKLKKKYIILTITLAWMILVVPPFWYYLIMSAFESIYTAINISWGLLIFFITLWKVFSVNEVKKERTNSQ